jgi:hypothetical protein
MIAKGVERFPHLMEKKLKLLIINLIGLMPTGYAGEDTGTTGGGSAVVRKFPAKILSGKDGERKSACMALIL